MNNDTRRQAADGNGITLREFIDREFEHQTTLLNERASNHASEHGIHLKAHEEEHAGTQQAIKVATDALNERLGTMNKEVNLKLDVLTKAQSTSMLERASNRGYMLGMGAVLGVVIVIANFLSSIFVKMPGTPGV